MFYVNQGSNERFLFSHASPSGLHPHIIRTVSSIIFIKLIYSWLYLSICISTPRKFVVYETIFLKKKKKIYVFSPLCLPLLSPQVSHLYFPPLPSDISTLQGNTSQYSITLTRDWDVSQAKQKHKAGPSAAKWKNDKNPRKDEAKRKYNERAFLFSVRVCVLFLNQWDLKYVCETPRAHQRWTSEHKLPPEGITQHSSVE